MGSNSHLPHQRDGWGMVCQLVVHMVIMELLLSIQAAQKTTAVTCP